jgi:hypothetical protein
MIPIIFHDIPGVLKSTKENPGHFRVVQGHHLFKDIPGGV